MSHKVTLQSNDYVQAVLVNGKEIVCDDGINMSEFLPRLCRELGVEYEYQYGDWEGHTFVEGKNKKKR